MVVLRMLSGDPGDLFLGGRLNQPLGYINAQATVFVLGLWLCFAAVERRQPLIAGAGAGLATLLACLVMLSQSRGAAIAVVASVLVALLVVPGRMRRAHALLLIAAGVALAAGPLLDVYSAGAGRASRSDAAAQHAMRRALLAALLVGVAWAAIAAAREAALRSGHGVQVRRAGAGVLALAAAAALAVGVANGGRIADGLGDQYRAFVHLSEPTASFAPGADDLAPAVGRRQSLRLLARRVERLRGRTGGRGRGGQLRPPVLRRRARRRRTSASRTRSSSRRCPRRGIIGALLLLAVRRRARAGGAGAPRGGARERPRAGDDRRGRRRPDGLVRPHQRGLDASPARA